MITNLFVMVRSEPQASVSNHAPWVQHPGSFETRT